MTDPTDAPPGRRTTHPTLSSVDLNLLVGFDALWTERSVTRAGRRLGLSQPATSGMLARLRAAFHDPLFVRGKGGLVPTPRCEELAPPIARALVDLRAAIERRPFDPATAEHTFVLGAVDAAIAVVVPGVLRRVVERAPRVRLSVRALDPSTAPARLESGELDLAIAPLPTSHASLESRGLFPLELYVLGRAGHPAAEAATLVALGEHPHVVVSFVGSPARAIDAAFAEAGLRRRVAAVVDSFLAAPHLVAEGDALAFLPGPFARSLARTGRFAAWKAPPPLQPPGGLWLRMLWSTRTGASPPARWLRELVVESAAAAEAPTPGDEPST